MWRLSPLVLAILLSTLKGSISYNFSDFLVGHPTAFSDHNRVLGLILSFNLDHIDPMLLIIGEYASMCEGGWNVTMVVHTTHDWSDKLRRYAGWKGYCFRTRSTLDIRFSTHDHGVGTNLASFHRKYLAEEINNYDMFIYHEDDIPIKHTHLVAYTQEIKRLALLKPDNEYLREHTIGFQRYRNLRRDSDARIGIAQESPGWGESDVYEQEMLEETPHFKHICMGPGGASDRPYIYVTGNIHQGVWLLTKQQILYLQDRCQFFNQSSGSREYMSSFSIFDRKPGHCGLYKILPGERFTTFQVYHYYQQRHVSWIPVINVDEDIHAGYNNGVPECWNGVVDASKKEQKAQANHTNAAPDGGYFRHRQRRRLLRHSLEDR